jgi:hypothetical protein
VKLLLSPRVSEDSITVRDAAIKAGWEVVRLQGWRTELVTDVGAIYGETLWARAVASQVGRVLLEPPLDWLTRLPHERLRRSVRFGTLDSLWPIALPAFIKPADDKRFTAAVYHTLDWSGIEGPILVSDPVNILAEWRVWVLEGCAVASSLYKGDAGRDPSHSLASVELVAELACKAAAEWTPRALVVDIGWTDAGNFVVIEANPCFGSGIYDADPAEVLEVLQGACVEQAPAGFTQSVSIE